MVFSLLQGEESQRKTMTIKNDAIPDDMPLIATTHQVLESRVNTGVIAVDGQVEDVAMANNPVLIVIRFIVSIVRVKYVGI